DTTSGLTKGLTECGLSHQLEYANINRGKLLISRPVMAMQASTHPETELVELTLKSNSIKSLGKFKTFNQAKYAANNIFVVAGADFKNGSGRTLPKNMLANNYDGQLYLLTDNAKKVTSLRKQYHRAIGTIEVLTNRDALFKVTE
ncbi:S9 family peptidase, partial [Pseudoalteromonas sp. S558]